MKRIFILIALFAATVSMNAQSSFEKDYTYGIWSNWSIGGGAMYTKSIDNSWSFGQGSDVGFDIRVTKQLARQWNMRIIAEIPGLLTSDANGFDRYGMAVIGFAWKPKNHFYVFADGGIASKTNDYGWLALSADAGIGVEFDVLRHSKLFFEVGVDVVADLKTDLSTDNTYAKIGWMYNFGLSETDMMILEQRRKVSELREAESEYNVDSLKNVLAKCCSSEVLLLQRIEVIENNNVKMADECERLYRENNRLDSVINSIRECQTNYYALPFSILFDVDSYTIKASQLKKIKAIASIMNDDTTVTYTITGFCDNTGSQEYNQKLSVKRAEVVRDAIIGYGVKEEQITVSGNGFDKPFSDGSLDVNRRVSVYRNL